MTMTELEQLATAYGCSDVPEFINTWVKCLAGGNSGMSAEINTNFDYKENKPIGPILRCTEIIGDMLLLVPSYDYYNHRWFVNEYLNISNIQAVFAFAKAENAVHKDLVRRIKEDAAAGKFVDRQNTKIRHYDAGTGVDPNNKSEAAQKVYEERINNDEAKVAYPK